MPATIEPPGDVLTCLGGVLSRIREFHRSSVSLAPQASVVLRLAPAERAVLLLFR